MNHIENNETEYQELEYDTMYPIVLEHYKLYEKSNFNVDILPEYDCMVNYITNTVKPFKNN